MKNFFKYKYIIFLSIILLCIYTIFLGAILKDYYVNKSNKRFETIKNTVVFFSNIPAYVNEMIINKTLYLDKPRIASKHNKKPRFKKFIKNQRNAILVLSRYDGKLQRSVVDIVDLNNFQVIYTYRHDILDMYRKIENKKKFTKVHIDHHPIRFLYYHPLIFDDGSLISHSNYSMGFKIDLCSNLKWINEEEIFHHSIMPDHQGNVWVPGQLNSYSKYIKDFEINKFTDDAIIKINPAGLILYKKSVLEILIQNQILPDNFAMSSFLWNNDNPDPIHLNDIEPVFSDTKYWKKGDVFLSIRGLSAIILYRPSTNKVINYITGPFIQQHDVDIVSEKEISIFNNNNSIVDGKYSEILIYNFETNKFRKLYNNQLRYENFKTESQGLSQILKDGALMVEEQNHGRIILFNNEGSKEWEFVNKDINGRIYGTNWSRIIEDKLFIEKFKSLIKQKPCAN